MNNLYIFVGFIVLAIVAGVIAYCFHRLKKLEEWLCALEEDEDYGD